MVISAFSLRLLLDLRGNPNRLYGNRNDGDLAKVVFSIVECYDRQFGYISMSIRING